MVPTVLGFSLFADLTASFDKFKVAPAERTDLVAALAKIKPDIVTAK